MLRFALGHDLRQFFGNLHPALNVSQGDHPELLVVA
jgi:hypothetical protein